MDKLSDRVLRPFTLPGDEKQILKDWEREHPREAELMRQYPADEPNSEEKLAAQMFDRAMADRDQLMRSEGVPAEYGDGSNRPQSSAAVELERRHAELRNAVRGAAEEQDAPRAVDSKPFKV